MEDLASAPRYRSLIAASPSVAGSVPGLVLMWFSLGSSLLPRSAMMQGIVGALSFAFGYGVGVFVWMLVKIVARRFGRDLSSEPAWVKSVLAGVFVAILLVAILRWPSWQSDQRQMVGLDDIGLSAGLFAALWMIALTGVLLFLGTSIRWVVWKLDVFNARHMSPHVARGVTTLIIVGIGALLVGFFTGGGLATFANERFAPGDNTTLEGITQPQNAEVSGSPGSVVGWDDLGFQGRTFTGAATTSEDIDAFYSDGTTALSPIRVYAGLKSADSPDDRAQLVVDELIRTNAQDRALLVLVATTGTGWVDPLSAATVEYMYKGDTAIAAMQYSFLPSWISFILDTATAIESGVAINDAVIEWWQTLPEDGRPKLIAFGESLGSLGSEAAYGQDDLDSTLAYIQSRVDGAFWVGPTNANEVHGQLVEGRDPSPVWRPDYDAGLVVRSANGLGEIDPLDADWAEPRVLYYHHASDPVGYWNWETLWTPQEWSQDPIGADVPDSVRWVPFTTFTQVVVDLINGFSASVGHGHNYNDIFVEGWSIVAPREGWTAADTQRLQDHLESLDVPGL